MGGTRKRVFAASCNHETHSFSVMRTTLEHFRHYDFLTDDAEIRRVYTGTSTEWGGALEIADELGWDIIGGLAAEAEPAGPITDEAFEVIVDAIAGGCSRAVPLDGVLLMLHGAMITDTFDDPEGELLRLVREIVGHNTPIAVTIDLHANVTEAMVARADIMTAYRTTPHLDQRETAVRAARLLDRTMRGEIRPVLYLDRPPLLYGLDLGRTINMHGPMRRVQATAERWCANHPELLDISIQAGYPYADILEAGPSAIITCNGKSSAAQHALNALSQEIWESRHEESIHFVSVEEAARVMRAASSRTGVGPTVVADYTDGSGGGGYGDGVRLLAAMLRDNIENAAYGPVHDPEVASIAHAAGVGASIKVELGGKTDPRFGGGPLGIVATVEHLSDGQYTRRGPFGRGTVGNMGPTACLGVGGVHVVVCTHRVQTEDREQFRIVGVQPEICRVIACKGINHFRADFEPIAEELVFVDTGGLVSTDLKIFPFRKVRRPVWPLDEHATWAVRGS